MRTGGSPLISWKHDERPLDSIALEGLYHFMPAASAEAMHTAGFYAFDTEVSLRAFGGEAEVRRAFECALAECRRFERLFSRTLPHSDISLLNSAAGEAIPISDDTFELLQKSIEYCERSLGRFDITMGSVCRLWDFRRGIVPSQKALDEALAHVDYRCLALGGQAGERFACLKDPLAAVDVGGTAKGYIADRLRRTLSDQGLIHFLINLGGNVVACGGKPNGDPFAVGIRDPQGQAASLKTISLTNGSVVTSGLTERTFTNRGIRYHHILDPKTGYPVETDAESVTIISPLSFDCDGFSTTLCSLGVERGLDFARRCPEISAAIFIDRSNGAHVTGSASFG